MLKSIILAAGLLAGTAALAQNQNALAQSHPAAPYAQVSELVELPEFIPGLGTLFVDPATLPAGLPCSWQGTLTA